MNRDRLALIMPVYNESGAIRGVIEKWTMELQRLGLEFTIQAYNDGSKDDTLSILKKLASENRNLIVHDKRNSGHGSTILRGYRENCDLEWIFQVDSDDEISPKKFEELWVRREEYDFLIGRRIRSRQPLPRKVMSYASRAVVRSFYGSKVFDVNSPYRLMRSSTLKDLFFSIPENTFAPNVIISGMVTMKNLRVCEIPVQQKERTTGEVSIKKFKLIKVAWRSIWETILFRFKGAR